MKLKVTLVRGSGAPEVDLVVTADAGATVGEVAEQLIARDPLVGGSLAAVPDATLQVVTSSGAGEVMARTVELAEAPLGSGAKVTVAAASTAAARARAVRPEAMVSVIAGPDSGRRFELGRGTHVIGREASSAVVLSDPLVSKNHARIDLLGNGARLVDLNSANGVLVEGEPVSRWDVEPGREFVIGDSVLTIELLSAAATADDDGTYRPVAFVRSPRVESRYPGAEFAGPDLPREQDSQPFPWLALVAPVVMGAVLYLITQSPTSLVFVALSPLLLVGNYVSGIANRRRKARLDAHKFDEQLARLDARLSEEVVRERTQRLREVASTDEIVAASRDLSDLLWTRRPEHWSFLSLRLGRARQLSRNTITLPGAESALPAFLARANEIVDRYRHVDDVPVFESLHFAGAIGIAGSADIAADTARAVIAQICGLHSTTEVVLAAIVGGASVDDYDWIKWLPHTSSGHSPISSNHLATSATSGGALIAELEGLIIARTRGAAPDPRGAAGAESTIAEVARRPDEKESIDAITPAVVLLVTDDAPVDRARLIQLTERAADAGIYPIWVAPTTSRLPAAARTFVDLSTDPASVGLVRLGEVIGGVVVERLDRLQALAFARALARVSDAGAHLVDESDLPRSVSMLSLVGAEVAHDPAVIVGRWAQNESIHVRTGNHQPRSKRAGRLRAIVGHTGLETMHLDLRTQGPHALVGGTTGSGKSEFLQAWVLGMAVEYSPDRLTFLFVDYKGGAAFADCVSLPHCVGLVTDLSPHLVRRALTSLRAELHYRERLLARKSKKDLLELERTGDPECPPSLVIVIDEFAALVGEVPEFVDGVVDIAQRGRSLGIHLIMATQRPAGVIRDNLRANTNLRIALRMADESDSADVVGSPVAASFDPATPGRSIAKTGPGRLSSFQSAYAGGWTTDERLAPEIDIAELRFGSEMRWEPPAVVEPEAPAPNGPTDQARMVTSLRNAAEGLSIPPPRRPWLDMLPPVFDLTKLSQRTDTSLILGVRDVPERQAQEEVYFQPDSDGHLAVFGTGGSGKTVALRTIATAAGITPRGGPVDVYGLDYAAGGLSMLEALPHVGSIVGGDEPDRVVRLLRFLRSELLRRAPLFAAARSGTIDDYRRSSGESELPRLLLLIDGFPAFRQDFDGPAARVPWYAVFQQIINEGRQLGIHAVITADRPGSVPTSVTAGVQRRVILRLADETGYSLLDAPGDVLSAASPAGRAIIDGFETQIALPGPGSAVAEQAAVITQIGEAMAKRGRAPAPEIGRLPEKVALESLGQSQPDRLLVGIDAEDLRPFAIDLSGTIIIAGGPGSGRTTAAQTLVVSARAADAGISTHYFGPGRSDLVRAIDWTTSHTSIDDISAGAQSVAALIAASSDGRHLVVIESIADYLSTPADAPLVELIKTVKRAEQTVIAEAETASWSSSWPLLGELKASRRGLILQPDNLDGDSVFKTPLPRGSRSEFPVGRGFFVERGKAVRVQVAMPSE